MDLKEIIRKAASDEPLTPEERNFLGDCTVVEEAELIAAREEVRRLEEENRDLTAALPEQERERRQFETRLAELRTRVEQASLERDAARQELARYDFRRAVDRLAVRHGFVDPDYLEFLCDKRKLDFSTAETGGEAENLMRELREKYPRLFRLDIRPGVETPLPGGDAGNAPSGTDDIASLLAAAPALPE